MLLLRAHIYQLLSQANVYIDCAHYADHSEASIRRNAAVGTATRIPLRFERVISCLLVFEPVRARALRFIHHDRVS
jgi:hypothetical protein